MSYCVRTLGRMLQEVYILDSWKILRKTFSNGPLCMKATVDFVNTVFHITEALFYLQFSRSCLF